MIAKKSPFGLIDAILKNCPFCGHEPSIFGTDHDDRSLEATIMCGNCDVNMSIYLAHGSKDEPSQAKLNQLEDAWNLRCGETK